MKKLTLILIFLILCVQGCIIEEKCNHIFPKWSEPYKEDTVYYNLSQRRCCSICGICQIRRIR